MKLQMQERLEELGTKIAKDDILSQWIDPSQLKSFFIENMSQLINRHIEQERQSHLFINPDDKANGFCPERYLSVGTYPIRLAIPRTRNGFYPSILPKYQRYLPEDYQKLLHDILLNAKSFNAARRTMQCMGLGYSKEQMNEVLNELFEEAKTFQSRPLQPDWFFLYMDAKQIHLADEKGNVKQATHFIALGVSSEARKEVLLNKVIWAKESIDAWRQALIDLKNRGLTRLLMIITDDFSGLTSLVKGIFPLTDHQLCMVHVCRNAYKHLNKEEYGFFMQVLKEIYVASSYEVALEKFTALCQTLKTNNSSYSKYLLSRVDHYLTFLQYPQELWPYIRSTNLPEGMNNLIETIKRNAGGHFHSQKELSIKMTIVIDQLHQKKWKKPIAKFKANLHELTQMFINRFEKEIEKNFFYTQNS
jgi:transposase-like protein